MKILILLILLDTAWNCWYCLILLDSVILLDTVDTAWYCWYSIICTVYTAWYCWYWIATYWYCLIQLILLDTVDTAWYCWYCLILLILDTVWPYVVANFNLQSCFQAILSRRESSGHSSYRYLENNSLLKETLTWDFWCLVICMNL